MPGRGRGRDQHGHRPVLVGADDGLGAVGDRRPRRPRRCARPAGTRCTSRISPNPRTRRSTSSTCATSRSVTKPCRPTIAVGIWRSPTRTATACSTCGRSPAAGLNTVHLLPVFDIATIPERRADQATPACNLESFGPSTRRRSRPASPRSRRPTASTGATTRGTTRRPRAPTRPIRRVPSRTLEFRTMVAALNRSGLRVVMDVVYNHTTACGSGSRRACSTGSCPATTTACLPPVLSRPRHAARTPPASTG